MASARLVGLMIGLPLAASVASSCVDGTFVSNDSVSIDNRTTRSVVVALGSGLSVLVASCGHVAFDPYNPPMDRSAIIGHGATVPPDAVEIVHELGVHDPQAIHVALWITSDGVRDAVSGPLPTCEGEPPGA